MARIDELATPPAGSAPRSVALRNYHAIRRARAAGRQWGEIAEALDLSVGALKAAVRRAEAAIEAGRINPAALGGLRPTPAPNHRPSTEQAAPLTGFRTLRIGDETNA